MTFDNLDGLFRACRETSATPCASFLVIEQFLAEGLGFRILAPQAAEGAPFEEDGRPNSRTIVDRVALDIENASFRVTHDHPLKPTDRDHSERPDILWEGGSPIGVTPIANVRYSGHV